MHRFLIISILALIGFGCQSSFQKKQICQSIKINIGEEPQTIDPRKARNLNSQMIAKMLFEGLTRINPLEKAELALAESVEVSEDLKTYTFHLRKSFWSNGDPVTAFDFAQTWITILSPHFPSDTAFHLYPIKNAKLAKEGKVDLHEIGVRAVDDKTLVVELEDPTPYFLDLLASPTFFPVNQRVDALDPSWAQTVESYVCNGPFQLAQWQHQDHLVLQKNAAYWDASSVRIEEIELQMLQAETELLLFEKKKLDWAGSPFSTLPLDSLKGLRLENLLKTKETLGTYFFRLNTQRPPLNHPSMRRAFALAVNRQAIGDYVFDGGIPATGLAPLSLQLQKEPYFQDGDVQEARKLFAEGLEALHLKKEEFPEITLLYRAKEHNHLIAQAVQQQWFEAFGIRVKLESIEGKVYFDRVSKQDYQMAACDWIADFADPINFLEVFKYKKAGSNNTLWENERYVQLLDASLHVLDRQKRLFILAQSEKILIEEMPIIPIFHYTMKYIHQPSLKNVALSSMGQIDFKWASLEDER